MKNIVCSIIFLLFSNSAFAQTDMSFIDIYMEPMIDFGMGDYTIGEDTSLVDKGSFNLASLGGRLGLKIGPAYIGFEYHESSTPGGSSDMQVSSSNRERYPLPHNARVVSLGPSIGFQFQRAFLWAALTTESMEQDLTTPENYEHEYKGTGYLVSFDFDVFKNIHAGIFYHSREFDKYTSTLSSDNVNSAKLDNVFKSETFGIKLSYFFSVSQLKQFAPKL